MNLKEYVNYLKTSKRQLWVFLRVELLERFKDSNVVIPD